MSSRTRRRIARHVAVVVSSIAFALGAAEVALRAARFEYHLYPDVQFGWPDPVAIANYN